MRLLFLANNRIPSEKANSLQIMQMCQAFQREGADVELVVPHRLQPKVMRSVIDPFEYYRLKDRFPLVHLPCLDTLEVAPARLQAPAFALQSATFALSMVSYLVRRPADICYSRDPLSTLLLALLPASIRTKAVYEAHTFPKAGPRQKLHLWAVSRIGRLVCISQGLAEEYRARGIANERILIAPDAVDLDRFAAMPGREEARQQLGIPSEARMVCYTGHLYPWKGAHTLARASQFLPKDCLVYVVGGTEGDLIEFQHFLKSEGLERVEAVGYVPPDRVPVFLAAADVLALPNSARNVASARYTSPMKLYEYMAARRPTVASRVPALQEVLRDGENALLVEPDDPGDLAQGIAKLLDSRKTGARLADAAWREVQDRSWEARARDIIAFLGKDVPRG